VKCFALALIVDHQKKRRVSDKKWVNHWPSILAVVNDVYTRFDDFTDVYPNGLVKADKLRTEYSDRYRSRRSKKWMTKMSECSESEIEALDGVAQVVLDAETRLHAAGIKKVRDHREEAKKPNGKEATRWPSDHEIRDTPKKGSTATPMNSTTTRKKSTATRKTPALKSKKRKRVQSESEDGEEEEKWQDEDFEEITPAPTARPNRKHRAAPIERKNRSRWVDKFDSDVESKEDVDDNEDDKDNAFIARPTTSRKTVVGKRSYSPDQTSFKFDYQISDDEQTKMPDSNVADADEENVNEGDDSANEDDMSASEYDEEDIILPSVEITDKGHAEYRRMMDIVAAAGRAPPPPQFAARTNTIAASNNAARNAIDLISDERPTKKVRFNNDATPDDQVDLTNDQHEPKMAPSLPSGNTHGLTDDDVDFGDPFGFNGGNQTYSHIDAVQDLNPNLLSLDQVPGFRPQQSRSKRNADGNLLAWTHGGFDDVVMFGEDTRIARPTTRGKTPVGERSNGPRHTYGFNAGSDVHYDENGSSAQIVNDAEDNEPAKLLSFDQAHMDMMQCDAGWQSHNAVIAANTQTFDTFMDAKARGRHLHFRQAHYDHRNAGASMEQSLRGDLGDPWR
jgi:hypothetical protein